MLTRAAPVGRISPEQTFEGVAMVATAVDPVRAGVLQTSGRGRAPRPEANPADRAGRLRVRRTLVLSALLLTVVVAAVGIGAAAGSAAVPPGAAPGATTTVVVAPRDTLWTLAAAHAPEGVDPGRWAAEVAEANGVDAGALVPGAVLVLPTMRR